MPHYTFYPCDRDGASDTFISLELADDDAAMLCALRALAQHPKASYVVGWSGDRKVLTRQRVHPDLLAVLTQPPRRDLIS